MTLHCVGLSVHSTQLHASSFPHAVPLPGMPSPLTRPGNSYSSFVDQPGLSLCFESHPGPSSFFLGSPSSAMVPLAYILCLPVLFWLLLFVFGFSNTLPGELLDSSQQGLHDTQQPSHMAQGRAMLWAPSQRTESGNTVEVTKVQGGAPHSESKVLVHVVRCAGFSLLALLLSPSCSVSPAKVMPLL